MTAAAALSTTRDPFMPRRPPGMRSGLALALLAHALLIAGLAYSVDWHSDEPVAVEAELWSAVPQQAAPRPVEAQTPPPSPAPAPTPAPAPAPKPPPAPPAPPPQVDPQIAIEKAREAKRVEAQAELAEQQEKARKEKARRDTQARQDADRKAAEQEAREEAQKKKQAADKLLAQKQQADKAKLELTKADQAKADKAAEGARLAQIKRMQSLAGATGDSGATGNALKSSGPSASYGGRIVARIKPNIVFPDAIDGNPVASVEIRVAPDGTITAKRLLQSSGVKAWDDAVLRAIDRTDGLPRDIDGRVPPLMTINFRPRDL